MTTQPINVSVVFDAQGRVHLQRGAEDLDTLAQRLTNLSARAGSSSRVLSTLQADLNRFGSVLRANVNPALNLFNNQFERAYSVLGRLSRYGFYALVGQFALVGLGLRKLGSDFISINQQFAQMEIVLKSVYGSTKIARDLRNELARLTIKSPLPFSDLSNVMRSYAAIPATSGKIAQQAYQPGGYSNQNGFLQRGVGLVEKLLAFRPDKNAEDAVFAIREALSGQLRSVQRRFDLPTSLLTNASGKSLSDLKKNPEDMFNALEKALSKIISPKAIEEMMRQPKILFQNLVEQLRDIPLLSIGGQKGAGGVGIYDRILDYFMGVFKTSGDFITNRFKPIAERIGRSLNSMFETIFLNDDSIIEKIMGFINLGQKDMPGLQLIDRIYEGFARFAEGSARSLPELFTAISNGVSAILPLFKALISFFSFVADKIKSLTEISPVLGAAGAFGVYSAPSLIRGGAGMLSEFAVKRMQMARGAFAGQFVSPNATLPNASGMNQILANQGYAAMRNAQGLYTGLRDTGANRIVSPGVLPPSVLQTLGLPAGTSAAAIRQALSVVYGSAVAGPVPARPMAGYSAAVQAARNGGFGPISSRIGAGIGGAAVGMGVSSGLASNLAVGAMGIAGAVGSVIVPMLIAVAATAAFTFLIDKASSYLREKRKSENEEFYNKVGADDSSISRIRKQLDVSGDFLSSFRSARQSNGQNYYDSMLGTQSVPKLSFGVGAPKGDIFGFGGSTLNTDDSQSMNVRAGLLDNLRQRATEDVENLKKTMDNKGFFGGISSVKLKLDPDITITKPEDAKKAIESITKWLNTTGKSMSSFMEIGKNLSGVESGEALNGKQTERLGQIEKALSGFGSAKEPVLSGFIEMSDSLQKISDLMNSYKDSNVSPQVTSEMDAIVTKLREEQNPFYALDHTFSQELDRLTKFTEAQEMMRHALADGAFESNGDSFDKMIGDFEKEVNKLPKNSSTTKVLKQIQSFKGMGQKFGDKSFEQMNGINQSFVDGVISDSLGPAMTTFQGIFADVGQMSDDSLKSFLAKSKSTFGDIATLAFGSGGANDDPLNINKFLGSTIQSAIENLPKNMPSNEGDLGGEELANIKLARTQIISGFLQPIVDAINKFEGVAEFESTISAAKLIMTRFGILTKAAQADVKRESAQAGIENMKRFQGALFDMNGPETTSPGFNADRLRALRAQRMQFYLNEKSPLQGYQIPDSFKKAMNLSSNTRGGEISVIRSKAEESLYGNLGQISEQYSKMTGLSKAQKESALETADAFYKQAEAAKKLRESLEGRGVFQSFTDGMTETLSQWRVASKNFQEIGKQFTEGFADGLSNAFTNIIVKAQSAKEAFRDFALSFIEMAVKMLMQKAVTMILGSFLGPIAGPATSIASSSLIPGVNTGYAKGGLIDGIPSRQDNRLAYVASGEYVIPTSVVQKYGPAFFDRIVSGNYTSKVSHYADGGYVGSSVAIPRMFIPQSRGSNGSLMAHVPVNVNVTVNNNGDASSVTTSEDAKQHSDLLGKSLRRLVEQEVVKNLRQGGAFRQRK